MVDQPATTTDPPLVVVVGPTASGKSHLALRLAERFAGEILSCDSVAVYRGLEIGAAKPTAAERALIPHHLLDLVDPGVDRVASLPQNPVVPFTAGDWARLARATIADITRRGRLPIVAGGTGLYLRALLDGLFPAPPVDPALRTRLRARAARRGPARLHRVLARLDPRAAIAIHPNDTPKLLRALELSLTTRQPMTTQWQTGGRDALAGYRVLRLSLQPPRDALHQRINARAAAMFDRGLLAETAGLLARFGPDCRALHSLGYAQALAMLSGRLTPEAAVAEAQAAHRQYAKRQGTWFRKEAALHPTYTLSGFGDSPATLTEATALVTAHLAS